jgi:hypothetical protein
VATTLKEIALSTFSKKPLLLDKMLSCEFEDFEGAISESDRFYLHLF